MPRGNDIERWSTRRSTNELDGVHHLVRCRVQFGHRLEKHIDPSNMFGDEA